MLKPRLATYGELVRTLARLNYSRDPGRSIETYTYFQHPNAAVGILLPVLPVDQVMKRIYLVGILHILEESNPAVAPEFEQWAYALDQYGAGAK
jgi:hypothetical protein